MDGTNFNKLQQAVLESSVNHPSDYKNENSKESVTNGTSKSGRKMVRKKDVENTLLPKTSDDKAFEKKNPRSISKIESRPVDDRETYLKYKTHEKENDSASCTSTLKDAGKELIKTKTSIQSHEVYNLDGQTNSGHISKDSSSVYKPQILFKIKDDVRKNLSAPMIELLEEKIALGYRDSRLVETIIEETDAKETDDRELNEDAQLSNSAKKSTKKTADHIEPSQGIAFHVYEKKNIHKLIDSLVDKTKEMLPRYKNFLDINIKQSLLNYTAVGDKNDIKNLQDALHLFVSKLREDYQLNKNSLEADIKHVSDKEYNALMKSYKIIGDIVEDHFNRSLVVECKSQLRKQFQHFANPSEESFLKSSAQIGVDLTVASIDGGYEISTQILGCDDTKIRVFLNQRNTLKAVAGNSIIKVHATGTLGSINGKVFNNLDDFIDFYADKLLLSIHNPKLKTKSIKANNIVFNDKKHRNKLISELPILEEALSDLEIISMQRTHLKYGQSNKVDPLKIKRSVIETSVGAKAINLCSIDVKATKWGNTFTKRLPLLQQLEVNPEWLLDYDKKTFNVSVQTELMETCKKYIVKHYPNEIIETAADIIFIMSKRLWVLEEIAVNKHRRKEKFSDSVAGELKFIKEKTLLLINENYQEYKSYCNAVNIARSDISTPKVKSNARKKQLEANKTRGAKCSADMLKMITVSHAKLKNIHLRTCMALDPKYDKCIPSLSIDEQNESISIEEKGMDISVPDIDISEDDRNKYLILTKQSHGEIKFKDTICKISLGPIEGLLNIRYITNSNEPNPDSDGDYLYIALRGSMIRTGSIAESSLKAVLLKFIGNLPQINGETPVVMDPMSGVDMIMQNLEHLKLELFFVKGEDGKYHIQYERHLTGKELDAKVGFNAPVGTPVTINRNVKVGGYNYHFNKEVIGDNTITYLMTRYNGWKVGNQLKEWDAFTEDKHNKLKLAKLMVNMSTDGNNARQEVESSLSRMNEYYSKKVLPVSEADLISAKIVLADDNALDTEKNDAKKVIELHSNNSKIHISEESKDIVKGVIQKSKKNGSWEQTFSALKEKYQHLKSGPAMVFSEDASAILKSADHHINSIHKVKENIASGNVSPKYFDQFLKNNENYLEAEKARWQEHKAIVDSDDVDVFEHKINQIENIQLQLHKYINVKRKNTVFGIVNTTNWINDSDRLPNTLIELLEKLIEAFGDYKSVCSKLGDGSENGILEHLSETQEFDDALSSFNQLLEANHEVYLKDSEDRFTDINPNKSKFRHK